MLTAMPKTSKFIFNGKLKTMRYNFGKQRKRIAQKLNSPRLKQIHFHTFRHWKGTTEYHKTQSIVHVKTILGHKCVESTMIYINLENALYLQANSEYYSATAKTIEEAQKLVETGFDYVNDINGIALYRKRK